MKVLRFLAVSAVCVALALFMVVHSFAISSYNAYSYWSSAQNSIRFEGNDIISLTGYSKLSGFNPPSTLQSEFYKNGYYSNNLALFSNTAAGTARTDLTASDQWCNWSYNGQDGSTPIDAGFVSSNDSLGSLNEDGYYSFGAWNGGLNRFLLDTTDKSQVTSFRFNGRATGTFPTSFARVTLKFRFEEQDYFFNLFCQADGVFLSSEQRIDSNASDKGYGLPQISDGQFHDYEFVISGRSVSCYVDSVLTLTFDAYRVDPNYSINEMDYGCRIGVFAYCYFYLKSISASSYDLPTSLIAVRLGKSITIPSGMEMEFYIQLRDGHVSNFTSDQIVDFDFSVISIMSLYFEDSHTTIPIQFYDDWLYIHLPAADQERIFTYASFDFTTSYVNMQIGDELQWECNIALSDVVIGDPDDIGYNPSVDPNENHFRDEVINGIGGIKDKLDDIQTEIHDGLDGVQSELADINSAINRDEPEITIDPELDPEVVLGESQAIEDYMGIINDAQDGLIDYLGVEAPGWVQMFFGKILSWTGIFPFIALLLPVTVVRALLGR